MKVDRPITIRGLVFVFLFFLVNPPFKYHSMFAFSFMDKDFIYSKLARLVCYILETGAWKYQYFWSYNNIIHTFTHKFKVNSKTVLSYVKQSMEKLIGKEYTEKQKELCDHIKRDDNFADIFLKTKSFESFKEISIEPRDKVYARAFREHYHLTRR